MIKKSIAVIISFMLMGSMTYAAENNKAFVYAGGESFSSENFIIRNNRTLVRYDCGLFEKLGYVTSYDEINHEVIIRNSNAVVTAFMNDYVIYRNGLTSYTADVRCDIVGKQIYIPLRGFAESLGFKVSWDDKARNIIIIAQD
ncbi:MAG: copper amine oxidase N-terminal domain-containing protein [Firmicutes bacterium]|nr:copper amine oxidase N-terminal domain-containing protein [Bacillota bacterium]